MPIDVVKKYYVQTIIRQYKENLYYKNIKKNNRTDFSPLLENLKSITGF